MKKEIFICDYCKKDIEEDDKWKEVNDRKGVMHMHVDCIDELMQLGLIGVR